jgi:uncharacterized protein DUF4406
MRIYIAGPMTGYPEFNYPAFVEAAAHLRRLGYDVVSPHEINPPTEGFEHPWDWYMRRDIVELVSAEAVVVLPGWEASKGASLETYIARSLGMPVYPIDDMAEAVA